MSIHFICKDTKPPMSHTSAWTETDRRSAGTETISRVGLSCRDAGIAAPRSIEWVTRLPCPVLMVRDAHDAVINAFEANEMAVAARRGYASAVSAVTLDSKAGTNGHLFEGSRPALVETIVGWVKARYRTANDEMFESDGASTSPRARGEVDEHRQMLGG